jgi:hypothetical protein
MLAKVVAMSPEESSTFDMINLLQDLGTSGPTTDERQPFVSAKSLVD